MGQSCTNGLRRILFLCVLHLSLCQGVFASTEQGKRKVTLTAENMPQREVFKRIEKQTHLTFLYSTSIITLPKTITIRVIEKTLDEVLAQIFRGTDLDWMYSDDLIIIRKKKAQASVSVAADSSITSIAVTGKVTDAGGNPVPGATIIVKGTKDGTTADVNGEFSLPSVPSNKVLVIRSVGYQEMEVPAGRKSINARLNLDVNELDETVVIAYGTTTKRFNTGNVSTVKGEDIAKQPISNPLQALQGRVPGMLIIQNTGVPGGAFSVQIRGRSSINPQVGNDPLYVIDGVPYTSQLLPNSGGAIISGGNPLNYINPNDIESIDVLKDADATAIYGSRGANGVVLITTRKAKAGTAKVDINIYSGVGKITRRMKLLGPAQFLQMRREALANDGVTTGPGDLDLNGVWDTTRHIDWQRELVGGSANYTDAQASVSGGSQTTQYMIGGGYHKETTVFPGDFSDQKGSAHFNITTMLPNKKFRATLSGNYMVDNNRLMYFDLMGFTLASPFMPQGYNKDGTLNWENNPTNPYKYLESKFKSRSSNLIGNALLVYEPLPGLQVKASLGYTNMQVDDKTTTPTTYFNPNTNITTGSASFAASNISSWIIEPQIVYQTNLGKGKISALVGTTIQQNITQGQVTNGSGYTDNSLLESLAAAATVTKGTTTDARYKYNALFGRVNYNWMDKYLVNLTARRDGSSRFGPGRQFANFGAVGAGWIFTKEKFIENMLPFLNYGKIRASYGTSGNDQIGDYRYLELYSNTFYPYQGIQTLYPANIYTPDFAWEVHKKVEAGLELGFMQDRILITASYYHNRSSSQLVNYSLPAITGFTAITANLPATVQNTGIELSLNTTNIKANNFGWTSSFNLTIPRNKLVSFPGFIGSGYENTYVIGEPLTITKVYHLTGVDPQTGVYQFEDYKGNPTFNPDYSLDRTAIINTAPKFYGGFQNNIHFMGFQLDFLFQFVKQTGVNYLFESNWVPGMLPYFNQPEGVMDRWQKPGDKAPIQRFTQDFSSAAYTAYTYAQDSDYGYSDASFIRLKNLSLSYNLPRVWGSKMHLKNCRLYVQGQNLLTITNYKGADPENQSTSRIPPLRVITAGIQITL